MAASLRSLVCLQSVVVALVRGLGENYEQHHPRPADVGLVIEVAEASLLRDQRDKTRIYARAGIPHYWLLDPRDATLSVYRWSAEGYLHVLGARRGERVRAEPFAAIELQVGVLFGDDEEA